MTALNILVKNRVFLTEDVNKGFNLDVTRDCYVGTQKDIVKSMKEYAKLKCEELLAIVADKAKAEIKYEYSGNTGSEYLDEWAVIDKDSILNAVDLNDFIK